MNIPPTLVLSLDFELRWGLRDRPLNETRERLLGARAAMPRILSLFDEFGVVATWATVGFLFARSAYELKASTPQTRPNYLDPRLDPYREVIGEDERTDNLHFAASLLQRIRHTAKQEIATHTFSHYYCNEPGQTAESFEADLEAAIAIARLRGIEMSSIVFPRNQHNPAYDDILLAHGITAYRGNPRSRMWSFTGAEESASSPKRSSRILDAYLPLHPYAELQRWDDVLQPSGLSDVRATTFLRPWSPQLRALEPLRIKRLCGAVRRAARLGRLIHLWWHPHNFGLHTDENLAVLRAILETFAECRERYGMLSLTMAEVDDRARAAAGAAPVFSGVTAASTPAALASR